MKTLQKVLSTMFLALVVAIPTFAGDMGGPSSICSPTPTPTNGVTNAVVSSPSTVPDISPSPRILMLAFNIVVGALSTY